ncbi:unnamed protein product, partial [Darwinula stevensoni]
MCSKLLSLVLFVPLAWTGSEVVEDRQSKMLGFGMPSIFQLMTFANGLCNNTAGDTGTCYKYSECKRKEGKANTACASGLGVCCVFQSTCRNNTSEEVSYFVNPSYPMSDSLTQVCDYRVDISRPTVIQIRLDFMEFELPGPRPFALPLEVPKASQKLLDARSEPS